MPDAAVPRLSIVVAVISGRRDDLRRCLAALQPRDGAAGPQTGGMPLEIIVPHLRGSEDPRLQAEFPLVQFVTLELAPSPSHARYDALRTAGLRSATADAIALLEDHAIPDPNWIRDIVEALTRHPDAAAIGGVVECGSDRALNRAVWFCDFWRYQEGQSEQRTEFISDTNVVYRRSALERVAHAWTDGYDEPSVHAAMRGADLELWTTPGAVTRQARQPMTIGAALQERFEWGRWFAANRARRLGASRWLLALGTPALPLVLLARLAKTTFERGRHIGRFLSCLPLLVLLLSVWSIGEFVGYVTAKQHRRG